MTVTDHLPLIVETAREAGRLAMRHFHTADTMEVAFKGQADLLCAADEEVEALIRNRLLAAGDDIAFLGEETGRSGPSDAALQWVVDPIDGTTNFLSGLPFAISIALARGTDVLAGAVYSPVNDEMFTAAKGRGAHLNGVPISIRNQPDPARFVVGTGLPLDQYAHSANAYERLHTIREQVAAIRILGSCALSLAHVACGRLDGYFEGPTGFLDCAAGLILLEEAGGTVTDFWGAPEHTSNVTFVAGAASCQSFLTSVTRTAERTRP
ncbi:inositol monophosphatase family protein [Halovulum sp. GXIMD14794]